MVGEAEAEGGVEDAGEGLAIVRGEAVAARWLGGGRGFDEEPVEPAFAEGADGPADAEAGGVPLDGFLVGVGELGGGQVDGAGAVAPEVKAAAVAEVGVNQG